MSQTTDTLKKQIQDRFDSMRTLRDEIKVRLHLASMDAKKDWQKIEPQLFEIEKTADDFTQATCDAVDDAVKRLSRIRASLS
jgi:hypothetical protein